MQAAQGAARAAWPAPLDRRVSLKAREITLRDALDRLSATAKVRLSYSSELLPLDRRVCVSADRLPLGDALAALVGGAGAQPVLVAGQVVLAPAPPASPASTGADVMHESVLERIVATGSPAGLARRPLTVGLGVVEGPDLARRSAVTLPEVLNGNVPGVWAWQRSPSALLAQYGSMRGASSFGATYPKVYIDGIETANPLVLTQLDPETVERVEVIRGPQGAALYGSDAISGVVNIVTRHDGAGPGVPRWELRGEGGVASSDFSSHAVATHRQNLLMRAGSNVRSLGLSLGWGGTGAVYPGAETRQLSALATGRIVGPKSILTTTVRYYDQRAGAGDSPLLPGVVGGMTTAYGDSTVPLAAGDSARQSLRQYTAGATLRVAPGGDWTYTFLAGVDGYRLNHLADSSEPFPATASDPLSDAHGGADRATLRVSARTPFGGDGPWTADLTFAAEHSLLREQSTAWVVRSPTVGARWPAEVATGTVDWRNDTGMLAQSSASWRNTVFLNGGVRLERNDAFSPGEQISLLPMLGAAWVRPVGPAEVKLRAAYGRGIRPAQTPASDHLRGRRALASALGPEAQAGVEIGAEVYVERAFSLQVTRFDQRATGLIQNVVLGVDTLMHEGDPYRRVRYQLQNVGEITNRGWEVEGSLRQGRLSLSGAMSLVDSRVRRTADTYAGDLQPGDRVLGVPAGTVGLTGQWDAGPWFVALTASRAWDWVGYDRLALAKDFSANASDTDTLVHPLTGLALRDYWRTYHGDTSLRATLSREVGRGVSLTVTGDNLLNQQLGEPDNATVRAGRTMTFSVRTEF